MSHSKMIFNIIAKLLALTAIITISACSGGDDNNTVETPDPGLNVGWQEIQIVTTSGGLVQPRTKVKLSTDNSQLHMVYYERVLITEESSNYDIRYLVWNLEEQVVEISESILGACSLNDITDCLDNFNGLNFDLDDQDNPHVVYQGGSLNYGGSNFSEQGDVMLATRGANGWEHYYAASGHNARNPEYLNGLAGGKVGLVIDNNTVHLNFQFYYEGIDSNGILFPDLRYISYDLGGPYPTLEPTTTNAGNWVEFPIEENDLYSTGAGSYVNAGNSNSMIIGPNGNPLIFYYNMSQVPNTEGEGLRMAEQVSGTWQTPEWLDRDDTAGDAGMDIGFVSAALAPNNTVGVAYYVKDVRNTGYTQIKDYQLRYAYLESGSNTWVKETADDISHCGNYCDLAFVNNQPVVAFQDTDNNDLILAKKINGIWESEVVKKTGSVGLHNTIFQLDGTIHIITSNETSNEIILLIEEEEPTELMN